MEIAHKEIIQTPTLVSKCWHGLMGGIKLTEEQLVNLYAELKPTPKAVCKRLCFPCEMKPDETVVSHHLKRFIRELNEDKLGRFVRFCTGSDLLISKKISVEFVNVSGLARRPVSQTCNSILELPKTYDNFPEFRAEFVSVLESNVWVMDIV
ncbi:unnamed protein product [Mytilus coruscus]|uniref:HECT domain-containing protein n=1 Tax=Mytilus coruscus TaxID=42192 RepID=A0A6J8EX41_MYTCO|nr:unnamed protein product [Mytilus coruscus]